MVDMYRTRIYELSSSGSLQSQPFLGAFTGHLKSTIMQITYLLFSHLNKYQQTKTTNSVALVRKRTIPTERPPLVGEVSDNFSG
jgi:hypothetical protein